MADMTLEEFLTWVNDTREHLRKSGVGYVKEVSINPRDLERINAEFVSTFDRERSWLPDSVYGIPLESNPRTPEGHPRMIGVDDLSVLKWPNQANHERWCIRHA